MVQYNSLAEEMRALVREYSDKQLSPNYDIVIDEVRIRASDGENVYIASVDLSDYEVNKLRRQDRFDVELVVFDSKISNSKGEYLLVKKGDWIIR